MSFTIRLLIWFKSRLIGLHSYGNRYYEEKSRKISDGSKARRWVIYKGDYEASKVPPEWHAWLHYRADQPLQGNVYAWQKPHQPNFTGTSQVCRPAQKKDIKVIKLPTKINQTYEPWNPNG